MSDHYIHPWSLGVISQTSYGSWLKRLLPDLDDKAKELLALERYLGELDNPQVALAVQQREPKTGDEAVTLTLEIQSYLRPGLRQEYNASAIAEEAEAHSISVTSSSGSGQDAVVEMLKTLTERLERLETSLGGAVAGKRPMRTTGTGGGGGSKRIVCYRCGQVGHIARNCAAEGKCSKQGN